MLNSVEVDALEKRWKGWKLKRVLGISTFFAFISTLLKPNHFMKIATTLTFLLTLLAIFFVLFIYIPKLISISSLYTENSITSKTQAIRKPHENTYVHDENMLASTAKRNTYANKTPNIADFEDYSYEAIPRERYVVRKNPYYEEEVVEETLIEPVYRRPVKRQKVLQLEPRISNDVSQNYELEEIQNAQDGIVEYEEEKEDKKVIQIESQEPKISIETGNIKDYSALKDKFYETDNIIYALMLAEEYYHNNDFKNALKWAMRANNLSSSNERSWIIFAKSLAKMGSKDKALKTLKAYLQSNPNASEVSKLIDTIKEGKY